MLYITSLILVPTNVEEKGVCMRVRGIRVQMACASCIALAKPHIYLELQLPHWQVGKIKNLPGVVLVGDLMY